MKEILDFDEITTKPLRAKNEKFAFITLLILTSFILIKFLGCMQAGLAVDSPLIPFYSIFYILQDTFISGVLISLGILISFLFFYFKRFTTSFLLNCFLIVLNIGFPYLYYNYLN